VAVVRRFSCTQCGMCCNRPPEVQLSEAAPLADVFVFRLMFRLYWLPQKPSDEPSQLFYEKKRLLSAFAARKYPVKGREDGKKLDYSKYLMVSALPLDTKPGACRALQGTQCGLYGRRPLSCRSVPFHYSQAEASAEMSLQSFVQTTGYRCDTGDSAPVVIEDGHIVADEARMARSEALAVSERDRGWREAIVRRMKTSMAGLSLPTLEEVERGAGVGVITTSMRVAWGIAAEDGLITADECARLSELQRSLVDEELAAATCSQSARQTLVEMQAQYRETVLLGS
jgi:Fe-S-cluster containining protein